MLQLKKTVRFLATTTVLGLSVLPALAQNKMMDSKMSGHKMMEHKMGGKMMSDKMVCEMCKMSPAESKTYMGMSKAEKALFIKHMDKMGGHKMMGGKMSGGKMMDHKMGKM